MVIQGSLAQMKAKITPKDVFANYKVEDLQKLYDKMVDLDVAVDKNPELEKLYETYGSDYERMKQDIMDELKRRNLTSKGDLPK